MKITNTVAPAITSGDLITCEIGISDNAEDQQMILDVLTSTLYTDKISAVLREIGCNAADANVEAGVDRPIEVCLPNKLEPQLTIRDFGFGMDGQQIANTFVRLGRSTKRDSNAYTGMLGIGSKSPLAYGNSYDVTSFTRGTKTIYSIYRDQGKLKLSKLHEQQTDASDGLEIKVPVRMEDFAEFTQKAERVYRYFKVRPIIRGAKVEFQPRDPAMCGTGWRYVGTSHSVAVMGNVGYDLTSTGMGGYSLDNKMRTLLDYGVELDFDIGELEIAANREGLQYKDTTKKAVQARLTIMLTEIGKKFSDQIAAASTFWEAHVLYGKLFEQMGGQTVRNLRDLVSGKVTWNGQTMTTARFNVENKEKDPEVGLYLITKNSYRTTFDRNPNPRDIWAGPQTQIVINDLPTKKHSPTREKGFFADPANVTVSNLLVLTFQTDTAQKRYWKARGLEGAPTILFSSITPLASVSSGGSGVHNPKHSAKAFVLDEGYTGSSYANSAWWKKETVDKKDGKGVYVKLDCFKVQEPTPITLGYPVDFALKVSHLRKANLLTTPLYGFKGSPDLGDGWVPLEQHLANLLADKVKKQDFAQQMADYLEARQYRNLIDEKHLALLPKGTPVHELLKQVTRMRKPNALIELVNSGTAKPWLQTPTLPKPTFNLDDLQAIAVKKYPLLTNISHLSYANDELIKQIADYIRLVESA